jgi:beta-glucosidase
MPSYRVFAFSMDGGDVPGSGMESQRENHSVEKSLNVWQSQRRQVLQGGGMVALTSLMSATAMAQNHTTQAVRNSNSLQQGEFPDGFLWVAATAGHQVEGGNINSDSWLLENMKPTLFDEPSGDACDHYHRFGEDIALLPELGLNTFRFSLEWSRIEPEPGQTI